MLKLTHELYDEKLNSLIEEAASLDIESEEFATAVRNLESFSKIKTLLSEPEPVPTTKWGKAKAGLGRVLDNETTRTLIKAGGALAGVVVVTYTTVHRDHVLERAALQQANQRNS